jgi:hypothetical protein
LINGEVVLLLGLLLGCLGPPPSFPVSSALACLLPIK